MSTTTVFNVSNRLPITISEGKITRSSGGLVAALEGLPTDRYQLRWIGWPGGEVEADRQPDMRQKLEQEFNCSPVFLDAPLIEGYYEGFSNSSIWPLLHY